MYPVISASWRCASSAFAAAPVCRGARFPSQSGLRGTGAGAETCSMLRNLVPIPDSQVDCLLRFLGKASQLCIGDAQDRKRTEQAPRQRNYSQPEVIPAGRSIMPDQS